MIHSDLVFIIYRTLITCQRMEGILVPTQFPGLEIAIRIWVTVRKACLSIWISPTISGFPVRNPSARLSVGLTISGFPVGNPGPRIGFTVFCVINAPVRSQGYIRLHGRIAEILSFPVVVLD